MIIRALVLVSLISACQSTKPRYPEVSRRVFSDPEPAPGLVVRLGEGERVSEAPPRLVPAAPLGARDAERIFARLPALAATVTTPFALREGSSPPPRTGRTVMESFPPKKPKTTALVPEATSGRLEVLRYAPSGDVPIAPNLSVTFSAPMVALGGSREIPVAITPMPKGSWRWVGTQTLVFEPAGGRFPMATEYRARILPRTRSASGVAIDQAIEWTFETPPPRVVAFHPQAGPVGREPLMFALFDQRIDPEAVLASIAAGDPLRIATAREVELDPEVLRLAEASEPGRWLALRPVVELPAEAAIVVSIGPGTPSAEGSLKTRAAEEFRFRTFGALRVEDHHCGQCRPLEPWRIELTNAIDAAAFRPDMVKIAPVLPDLRVDVFGDSLAIHGRSKGRTTYTVTLAATLPDRFGQVLGRETAVDFVVTSASPRLSGREGLVVLDPHAARFPVYTINYPRLRVRAYEVGPESWGAFEKYLRRDEREPPGRKVLDRTVEVAGEADELVETPIDLSAVLPAGVGQIVLVVEPDGPADSHGQRRDMLLAWVEVTKIGLDAFVDHGELIGWATSLGDGRPLQDVTLELMPKGASARTGADGVAVLPLGDIPGELLVARRGSDVAILPESGGLWSSGGWERVPVTDELRWYVVDDRKMYRPGEEVRLKAWLRRVGGGKNGDLGALDGAVGRIRYALSDSQGNEVAKGEAKLDALGGFTETISLPKMMNLGTATLSLEADSRLSAREYEHFIEVEEFRRPEFEVVAQSDPGPYFVTDHADVTVQASYYAGGGLADAQTTWSVTTEPTSYSPPNREDFTFGIWTPWWEPWDRPSADRTESYGARTDSHGKHSLRIDLKSVSPPEPTHVEAEATVMDVNRQAWSAKTEFIVHAADEYVGLKSDRLFVSRGTPLPIDLIVTDIDGQAIVGRETTVTCERTEGAHTHGAGKEGAKGVRTQSVRSGKDPVRVTCPTDDGGVYRITASIVDKKGRRNETQLRLWVAGGKLPPKTEIEEEKVTLVPNHKEYRAGEDAEILVVPPFVPAEGILTVRRSGILYYERFSINEGTYTLRIPIKEAYTPNLQVKVDLVGARPSAESDAVESPSERQTRRPTYVSSRPAYARGELDLDIPPYDRVLALSVSPRARNLEPGGQTTIDLALNDAQGRPVKGGQVAVIVVDEAVLALTDYELPDPMAIFYPYRSPETSDHHLREQVLLALPEEFAYEDEEPVGRAGAAVPSEFAPRKMAFSMNESPVIRQRTDFAALATFAPNVVTDANGRAQVQVMLPDNLTRYRVMAVAVAGGKQFGKAESTITARLPLMVRPSAPRFLNYGDRFELPVVIQNQTNDALEVDVAVRATNATVLDPVAKRARVAANDRIEVRFPVSTQESGIARFQVGAVSGSWADASLVELPVWTPATTEALATYGQIDSGAIDQRIETPRDIIRDFGGVEITTSSTALSALTDAVIYLTSYPFECAEQLASRMLAIAALRDVLTAFAAEGLPSADALAFSVARDLERLAELQDDDGGFPFWRRGDDSWPFVSIHVAHALASAKAKEWPIPDEMWGRTLGYLRSVERHIPREYDDEIRHTLTAYALYVRTKMGDKDPEAGRKLVAKAGGAAKLPVEANGWLITVLSGDPDSMRELANIRAHLANRVTETAATAHFVTSYTDRAYLLLHSERRADGIILEGLLRDQPKSYLVPKLAFGLLAHRTLGRWSNTQENAFVLLALDAYFRAFENTTPDFVAKAWLGEALAGEHAFRGRTTERHHLDIPMSSVGKGADIVIAKEGLGRLYYRLGMRYAPASLELEAVDSGFTVLRTYEGADSRDDVRRDADGTWRIKAGARVRIALTMVTRTRRYHVALTDPLPAGLEPQNPALAISPGAVPGKIPSQDPALAISPGAVPGKIPSRNSALAISPVAVPGKIPSRNSALKVRQGASWPSPWFEHQNLRDERAEAFTSLLREGVYTYSYIARASTPGRFVVPPPKAEEMYHPETFGRGASNTVVVE